MTDESQIKRSLLIQLSQHARSLTPYVHEASKGVLLDEKNEYAAKLCSSVEKCLLYGIKINEFYGTLPFWGLLEQLESVIPPIITIRNSVGAVACIPSLRTPTGKTRGWIRQALNTHCIEETITIIENNKKMLNFFYSSNAILACPDDFTVLVSIIRSLKVLKFNYTVDNEQLNQNPSWIGEIMQRDGKHDIPRKTSAVAVSAPTTTSTQRAAQAPAKRGSGGMLDSFFSVFESSMDRVLQTVDVAATNAVNYISHTIELPANPHAYDGPTLARQKIPKLFGSPLKSLLLSEIRCDKSYLDPSLGVPTQVENMINALRISNTTKGLFRHTAPMNEINHIRDLLELEKEIPANASIHALAQCFLQWLYELPEPLLGFAVYDAIQSCQEIENEECRIRNLSLLLEEVPWYNQATLSSVMTFLHELCQPEICERNGLNTVAISVFSTPFILRPKKCEIISSQGMTSEESDSAYMAAAAAGGAIMEDLLRNYDKIFYLLNQNLENNKLFLRNKCNRLQIIQKQGIKYICHRSECTMSFQEVILGQKNNSSNKSSAGDSASAKINADNANYQLKSNEIVESIAKAVDEDQLEAAKAAQSIELEKAALPFTMESNNNKTAKQRTFSEDERFASLSEQLSVDAELYHIKSDVDDESLYIFIYDLWCALRTSHVRLYEHEIAAMKKLEEDISIQSLANTPDIRGSFVLEYDEGSSHIESGLSADGNVHDISLGDCVDAREKAMKERENDEENDDEKKRNKIEQEIDDYNEIEMKSKHHSNHRLLLHQLMQSKRWKVCFPNENPLFDFSSGPGGLLAIQCFTQFLNRFGEKAANVVYEFATHRHKESSLAMVSLNILQMTLTVLQLISSQTFLRVIKRNQEKMLKLEESKKAATKVIESPKVVDDACASKDHVNSQQQDETKQGNGATSLPTDIRVSTTISATSPVPSSSTSMTSTAKTMSSVSPLITMYDEDDDIGLWDMQTVAKKCTWKLLSDDMCLEEFFCVGMLTMEDLWKLMAVENVSDICDRVMTSTKVLLLELVNSHVGNMDVVWKLWTEQRVARQQVVVEAQLQIKLKTASSIPPLKSSIANEPNNKKLSSKEAVRNKNEVIVSRKSAIVWYKSFQGLTSLVIGDGASESILTESQVVAIEKKLPASLQCCDWSLKYRLVRDGASLSTLLRLVREYSNTLMVIKDSNGGVFGVLVQDKWACEGEKYYGSGTCKVFTFVSPTAQKNYREGINGKSNELYFEMYNCTMKNSYFMLTSQDSIAIGGGQGFAILLDADLSSGCSNPCDTFDSPSLTISEEFTCVSLDVYAIQPTNYKVDEYLESRK